MRLIHLSLSGFGPFPGREDIDFAALASTERFLIEGPTGVGKTTIIDAITYALYSGISGEDSSGGRLRCTFALPSTPTWVDLVFSTAGTTWRIRRSPAYLRPKKRGEGLTTQPAEQTLWRWDGEVDQVVIGDSTHWDVQAVKANDIGSLIPDIIGLNREQFLQTIVLPQGRFATFLRASSLDRRQILTTIFGTQAFERFEEALADEARQSQKLIDSRADAVRAYLTRLDELVRAHAPKHADRLIELSELSTLEPQALCSEADPLLTELLEHLKELRTSSEKHANKARTALRKATAALQAAKECAKLRTLHAQRLTEQATLKKQAPEIASLRAKQEHAERAAELMRVAKARDDAADAHRRANSTRKGALTTAINKATAVDPDIAAALATTDAEAAAPTTAQATTPTTAQATATEAATAERILTNLTELITQLEPALAAEKQLTQARSDHRSAAQDLTAREKSLADLHKERTKLSKKRETLTEAAEHYDSARDQLRTAESTLEKASALVKAAKAWDKARTALATHTDELEKATAAAAHASGASTELTARWTAAVAGRLAQDLEKNSPCPVCGATDHPRPAAPDADTPSDEQVEAAQQEARVADLKVAELTATVTTMREQVAKLGETADHCEPKRARTQETAAKAAVTAAQKAVKKAEQARTDLAAVNQSMESFGPRELALTEEISTARARERRTQEKITELTEAVTAGRAHFPSVTKRADAYERTRKAVTSLVKQDAKLATAAQLLSAREADAEQLLADSPFADWEAVANAVVDPKTRDQWTAQIDEHKRLSAVVAHDLGRKEVRQAASGPAPDIEGASAAETAAEEVSTRATATFSAADDAATRASALTDELRDEAAGLSDALSRGGTITRLAKLARGETSAERIPLSTFVLLRNFEVIIRAANDHLGPMCDNRYELVYAPEERSSQARRHGLGLEVIDRHDGSARATTTLSGGETFYVSLSLALGLADVVRSVSGGVELGTLFVDEGFGSLDEETLANVLETLTTSAGQGRILGIISHVEELKTVIPDRIQISRLPSQAGSTLKVITAAR